MTSRMTGTDAPERAPFFLFVGPDKVGSTWLGRQLDLHPELHVTPAKDIYYFDRNYARGPIWYRRQFTPSAGERVLCDISHDYLFSPAAARRIRSDVARPRLLCLVRSPLERSFSQFLNYYRSGKSSLSFGDATREHPEILENSHYAKHLPPFVQLFGAEELMVTTFDRFTADPAAFLRELFQFIGVDPQAFDYAGTGNRVYEAGRPRNRLTASLAKDTANLLRRMGLPRWVGAAKGSRLARLLYTEFEERPSLTPAELARYGGQFEPDLDYLESTFGFELTRWRHDLGLD